MPVARRQEALFLPRTSLTGCGGLDIYYSNWRNGYWEDPVNLGLEVNTEGNETYPFISETGELFFSSDGREDLAEGIYTSPNKRITAGTRR